MSGQPAGCDNSDMDEEEKRHLYGEEAIIEASCIKSCHRYNVWGPSLESRSMSACYGRDGHRHITLISEEELYK